MKDSLLAAVVALSSVCTGRPLAADRTLAHEDTFDRTPFSPNVQKTVFEFPAADVPNATIVPSGVASFLLDQASFYAGASLELLGAIRLHRALAFGSSVRASCRENVRASATSLQQRMLPPSDRKALLRYADELGVPAGMDDARVRAVLERMARD